MEKVKPWAWIVLVAAFFSMFFNSSLNYSVGVIHIALLEKYPHEDVRIIAWLGSLFSCMFAIGAFLASFVINLTNARFCVMLSGFVTLVGFALSSLVTDVKYLFITYSLIAGTGQALCNAGTMVSVGYYFKGRTGMASGIAASGCGLCTFVFPPLSQYLVDTYGLHGAFLLLGGLGFQSTVCGTFLIPTKYENKLNWKSLCRRKNKSPTKSSSSTSKRETLSNVLNLFTSLQFVLFLTSSITFNMAQSTVYLFLPDYFRHLGSTSQEAAFILSISGITGTLSRVMLGFLVVVVDIAIIYGSTFGIIGIITFFLKYMKSIGSKLTYTSLIGFYLGACWSLNYTLLIDIVGLNKLPTALGINMFICGIGYLTGPPLAEMIVFSIGDYYYAFLFAGFGFLCACVSGFLVRTVKNTLNEDDNWKQKETNIGDYEENVPVKEQIIENGHLSISDQEERKSFIEQEQ